MKNERRGKKSSVNERKGEERKWKERSVNKRKGRPCISV